MASTDSIINGNIIAAAINGVSGVARNSWRVKI